MLWRAPTEYECHRGKQWVRENEVQFFRDGRFAETHANNCRFRQLTLKAGKELVNGVLERYLKPAEKIQVLEIGCGTGFWSKFLRPSWMTNVISVDVNYPSLKAAQGLQSGRLVCSNIYDLGVASSSVDAVVGLSAFDSFLDLRLALSEAARCLAPGRLMFLFQDVIPDLHREIYSWKRTPAATENYHRELVRTVSALPGLQILEGKNKHLSGIAVEPASEIKKRVDAKLPWDVNDLLIFYNNSGDLHWLKKLVPKWPPFLIEIERMRYLVVKKNA